MATKKRKRKSSARKTGPKGFFLSLAILSCLFISLGLICLLSSKDSVPPPLYEEVYLKTSDLEAEIMRVDRAIFESLYREGVPERDILFLTVEPKYAGDREWDFTELQIRISERKGALQLDKIIRDALSQLSSTVSYSTVRVSPDNVIGRVSTLGHLTHKIDLLSEPYRGAAQPIRPKIAIIIDDLGFDLGLGKAFVASDLPLSLSLLPLAPYTRSIAEEGYSRGRELILHLPMEPEEYPRLDPGPGALLSEMKEKEILRAVREYLDMIPGVRGVNNHMGSRFTQKPDKMGIVLGVLKRRGLFYVDSRTTAKTAGFALAKKMGVPAARRSVFLDNDLSPQAIRYQMERLLGVARHSGAAVGIGHPHKETLKILAEYADRLKAEFQVVNVLELVG